jgi:hypothetical protein
MVLPLLIGAGVMGRAAYKWVTAPIPIAEQDDRTAEEKAASAQAFKELTIRERHEMKGEYIAVGRDNW